MAKRKKVRPTKDAFMNPAGMVRIQKSLNKINKLGREIIGINKKRGK